MIKVCSFEINGKVYNIYDVDKIEGKTSYVGRTNYDTGEVCIEIGKIENMLLTLKHELTHIWLYENGHTNQNGTEIFSYEEVCEIVAYSNNSINRIVKLYLENKIY